jgi:peptidyl-tRNA hydrolase, PTH1 family
VVHDDLALPFGTLRTREKGSDAGNNGIKSLNAHLGENYARIRVGTHTELAEKLGDHDFVLSKFTAEESEKLQKDIFPKISDLIDNFIAENYTNTSHVI